ncbi:MAG TPA: HAD-IC family P-type ATPase, partial [Clostridia bacterium]|nr:HAD-IC family P-type ATPase [Clostridia bacterium]
MPTSTVKAEGLTRAEAQRRLKEHGPNTLVKKKRVHPIALFFQQFADFLTIILLMSTGLSLILGEHTEAITILAIVVLNALLGFLQEYRTEKTIEALKGMAAPRARVLRDGHLEEIPAADLVPGDRIALEQGDRVPADATLLEGFALHVDESLLTGESVPVEKVPDGPQEARSLYMGTLVTQGRAGALITATGMDTQMGHIAGMLGDIEEPKTPLQIRLDQLGKYIAIGCLAICGIVSVTGILRGENVLDMVVMGISLSVAAVPEGLSAIVTIALALAVGRMVRRKALVR